MADLEQEIRDAVAGPAKATTDAGSMEQHRLRDLIDADKHLEKKAASTRRVPFRIQKMKGVGPVQ